MSVLTIADLKIQINSQINTNGINGISGAGLNQNFIDTIDSIIADFPVGGSTFYSVDGTLTGLRTVSMNGFASVFQNGTIINKAGLNDVGYLLQNTLGVEKGSLGYDVGLDSASLELKNTAGTFFSAIDGFVGVGTSTPLSTEVLGVNGYVNISLGIGANGTNGSGGVALRTALDTTAVAFGTTGGATLYQTGGKVRLTSPAANSPLKFELGLTQALDLQQGAAPTYSTELVLKHLGASSTAQKRNAGLRLISGYWSGAASQDKEANILHNVTAAPSGISQLDFSIAGTNILSLKDSGVFNISNAPTSAAGLVAGDVWNNSGVLNII